MDKLIGALIRVGLPILIRLLPVLWNLARDGFDWVLRKISPGLDKLLVKFAGNGEINAARIALKEGAEVNAFDSEALCRACSKGDEPMVDLLLRNDADVHGLGIRGKKDGLTQGRPLYEARKSGFNSIADKLIAHGAVEQDLEPVAERTNTLGEKNLLKNSFPASYKAVQAVKEKEKTRKLKKLAGKTRDQ